MSAIHLTPELLRIRQLSLRQRLPPDGASQEIDEAWAAVQRCSHRASQHGELVCMRQTVGTLCAATGILLVYMGAEEYSMDVYNQLAGLKQCVLQEAALLSEVSGAHDIDSCCGVICSLLLTQHDTILPPLTLRRCIAAAAGEVVVQQALATRTQDSRSTGAGFGTAPILIYASSIFAAFSWCVLAAQAPAEIQSLLDALETSAASTCLPKYGRLQHDLSDEQRAVLQRAMVPVLHPILERLDQLTSAPEPPPERIEPAPVHGQRVKFPPLLVLQHITTLLSGKQEAGRRSLQADFPEATAGAVKVARILSMVYHAPSRSSSPRLATLISTILGQLVQSDTSALLLAQHIMRPSYLYMPPPQHSHSPIATWETSGHAMRDDLSRHAVNACTSEDSVGDQTQQQERAELYQCLTEVLLPSIQCVGHWQSAACFMLQVLTPCLRRHLEHDRLHTGAEFWDAVLHELLPVLQVLSLSQTTVNVAVEVFTLLAHVCPDAVPAKARFCKYFLGVLCLYLPDSAPDQFASALAGVAKYCQPVVTNSCCMLCCSMSRVGATPDVQLQVVRALVSAAIHGNHECLCSVLELISRQVQGLGSDSDKERAFMHVRHGLMHCHDFRKKSTCVRWFHAQLSSLHPSSL